MFKITFQRKTWKRVNKYKQWLNLFEEGTNFLYFKNIPAKKSAKIKFSFKKILGWVKKCKCWVNVFEGWTNVGYTLINYLCKNVDFVVSVKSALTGNFFLLLINFVWNVAQRTILEGGST